MSEWVLAIVNALLSTEGVDPNQAMKDGSTPLYIACQNGYLDLVNAMLSTEGGSQLGEGRPLYIACQKGYLDVVNAMLSTEGVDPNQAMKDGLHHCTLRVRMYLDLVNAMLSTEGVDPNQAWESGATPLYVAPAMGT